MCICLVFGGKQILTIIAYSNIIFSTVSLGIPIKILKYTSLILPENINFICILVYLEFVTEIFKNTFQIFFLIFTLFILFILLHSVIDFSYLNCTPHYLNG